MIFVFLEVNLIEVKLKAKPSKKFKGLKIMGKWLFKEIERGTPERNPRETEFFRLTSPSEAVVREFIQNSLDARLNQETIKVKISIHTVFKSAVSSFLDDTLKDHLIACGLLSKAKGYPENVRCLLLEDFGTSGLDGDYSPDAKVDGNFYNFWWREGISQKLGQKAGRWGLGKTTFHLISKIKTMWGLTIRNDDGKVLLMGKALLKTHELNGKKFQYFGYFANENYMPVDDISLILAFKSNFKVKREITGSHKETGLSIVIPYIVDEINFDSLTKGVLQHYFYSILSGMLNVEIQENEKKLEINSENLIEIVSKIDWTDTEWENLDIKEILKFVKSSLKLYPINIEIGDPLNPQVTQESFGAQFNMIKQNFLEGKELRFKIPIFISRNNNSTEGTFFTILLKRFPEIKKPFEGYIRSGILVSEVKMLGNRPVAGLLIAEDPVICEFLGDCETPAHTNWNARTEGFSSKYKNAVKILSFIKKSILQIVSILDEPPRERLEDFLKEIFSISIAAEEKEGNDSISPPVLSFEGKLGNFNIYPLKNGFKITLNKEVVDKISFPFQAIIRIAYATRRGNPFAQYEKFDFDVSNESLININGNGCNIIEKNLNVIKVEITSSNFELEVTGFDSNRDLLVDVKKI